MRKINWGVGICDSRDVDKNIWYFGIFQIFKKPRMVKKYYTRTEMSQFVYGNVKDMDACAELNILI